MLGDSPSLLSPTDLIDNGLAGCAVARAAVVGEQVDPRVATARVAMAARHLVAKRELTRLVRAWRDAGLEALVFKGFALAEFMYPDPTWRVYSDVDVALRPTDGGSWPELAEKAANAASALGFAVLGRPEYSASFDSLYGESYRGPALMQLAHTASRLCVDVHLRLVHNSHDESRSVRKQEAITAAVWRDSQACVLAGVPLRLPSPVDAAVVGLILSRSWSTDASRLRPHDYLDLETLYSRHGVDRAAVLSRAAELGCLRTARLFLRRCDPATRTLDLRPPNAITRFYYDTVHAPERGHRTVQVRLHEARYLPARAVRTAAVLPDVAGHVRLWRSGAPAVWPAERLPDGNASLDRESWRLTQFAVRRAFQLCGVARPERRPDLAQAALLYALRKRGVPASRGDDESAANARAGVLTLHGEVLRPTVLGIRR